MISMYTGVAGLRAHEKAMDVIANNIANINTVGFKSAKANFQETLVQTMRPASSSGANPMQIGLGVEVSSIENLMTQGNLQSTINPTDLAISGNGYFILSDGNRTAYSRDGSFILDANNNLVSASNQMRVAGWSADPITGAVDTTGPITPAATLTVPIGTMSIARQTSEVSYQANLDATAATGTVVPTAFSAFDSLGREHRVDVTFTKTAVPGQWSWQAAGADFTGPASGTISFDTNGRVTTPTGAANMALAAPNGANAAINMTLDFGLTNQLAGTSTIQVVHQDGMTTGTLTSFAIDDMGIITGVFSNGLAQVLGQVAMARVPNPAGLQRMSGNLYSLSANSGEVAIGPPNQGGNGKIVSGYLEMSNVDLANEFANMIITQRGFQANSKIITTADEMLQDVMMIKR